MTELQYDACYFEVFLKTEIMKKITFVLMTIALTVMSCSSDDVDDVIPTSTLTLNLTGLENLGADYVYEGWIVVGGVPVTTGVFTVSDDGTLSNNTITMQSAILNSATKFVLSIEPKVDPSPDPSETKLLVGDFSGNTATVGTGSVADDFSNVKGGYIAAAPTGTMAANEEFSGIWFIDNSSGSNMPGLTLPTLADGWKYEGWVVIDGKPLSTGTFTAVDAADDAAPFSGTNAGPAYPGEDFLVNAPDGVVFPTDVRGKTAVISIEPYPDNSASPFTLKPLAGMIPADLMGVGWLDDNVSGSFPSGTVTR